MPNISITNNKFHPHPSWLFETSPVEKQVPVDLLGFADSLQMLSFNNQPIGLIVSQHNLDELRRLSPRINSKILLHLPNDSEPKNQQIAFQKWIRLRRTVFLDSDELKEYEEIESEIVKIGYYLPFNILKKGQKSSCLNRKKFWGSVLKLIMQPNVQVLNTYNDLLESLYGGKVNESYFVIKQLNDKRWLALYKEGYGIFRVNNGKFEPTDYPNPVDLMCIYDQYTYGHAFGKHMKGLSQPLFYYFDGIGLRPYIRIVLGPAHDAHHPILGFSTPLYEEVGILSFYTFYDHRFNVVPTYWAPGLVGVAGGLLKANFDYLSLKLNKSTKGDLDESKNLVCRWVTNAWLGMHLAENAKVGFYSYPWLSHDTFAKSLNHVRQELGILVNQDTIDLKNSCNNVETVPIFWRLIGVASRIMYEISVVDNPYMLQKLSSDLKEELIKAVQILHGIEKIRVISNLFS